jgi:arylsulfatase
VLLIVVDTLRFDGGRPPGRDGEAVPVRLRARGRHFDGAIAAANWTTPSMVALMTGRYASEFGVLVEDAEVRVPADGTLAAQLRRAGYATAAVVSNPFLSGKGLNLETGFDVFDARVTERELNRDVWTRNATQTTDAALHVLDDLRAGSAPWFLWVHYMEPHGPYRPPARYVTPASDPGEPLPVAATDRAPRNTLPRYQALKVCRGRKDYLARYRGSASYALDEVDRLVRLAEERGALSGAVVVFTADHGEFLGEDGYWFQHGVRLDPALVHVPLVVAVPGQPLSHESRPVSHIDIPVTLLRLARAEGLAASRGEDLFEAPTSRRFPILSEYVALPRCIELGVVLGDRLVVRSSAEPPEAFRRSGARWDRSAPEPDLLAAATKALEPQLALLRRTPIERHTFTPEELKKLRALGYLGSD